MVPRPKMNVAIKAVTRVGRVLATEKRSLTTTMTTLFFMILEEANIATGMATKAPTREPMMLILIVSNNGPQIDGMYPGSGGNIFPSITQN